MGASFCHVERTKHVVRLSPCITSGNQVWNGAIPALRHKAMNIICFEASTEESTISQDPHTQAWNVAAKIMTAVAVACTMKYFVVASAARGYFT